MNEEQTGWELYPNMGKGGRSLSGEFVTITVVGNLTISEELTRRIDRDRPYMQIEYHAAGRKLRLTPLDKPVDGSLKIMMPGRGRGVSARIGTSSGFKRFGIVPKAPTRYSAQWLDGAILVDLGKPFDEGEVGGPCPVSREPSPDQKATERMEPRTCGSCIYQQFRLCTNEASPHRRKVGPLDRVCNEHKYHGEKRESSVQACPRETGEPTGRKSPGAAAPKQPRQGSRPKQSEHR